MPIWFLGKTIAGMLPEEGSVAVTFTDGSGMTIYNEVTTRGIPFSEFVGYRVVVEHWCPEFLRLELDDTKAIEILFQDDAWHSAEAVLYSGPDDQYMVVKEPPDGISIFKEDPNA